MDELELPPMVVNNEDPKGTAFSVSVDATSEHGKCDSQIAVIDLPASFSCDCF